MSPRAFTCAKIETLTLTKEVIAMIKRLTVFCGARPGENPVYRNLAQDLGRRLASTGIELVYGGGGYGLMGELANATLDAGGRVTGVITEELADRGAGLDRLSRLEITSNMDQRKDRMMELADGFLALPGGLGTLEEVSQVCSWITLGDNPKPVAVYNVDHFYDPLASLLGTMHQQGFLETPFWQAVYFSDQFDQILNFMTGYQPPAFRVYHK